MVTLTLVVLAIVGVLAAEFYWHRRSRGRIPIRIHVNGVRGKSSVVRLIAAGLRQGGIRTWAKVTGTLPNLVNENGEDIPIVRGAPPSIIEQRAVVAEAAAAGVQALVLECMALQPAFQRAEESLLRPTVGVITNVRLDHEEVFGPSLLDIALALSNTIPRRGVLITTSGESVPVLKDAAGRRQASVVVVETDELPDSLVEDFSYIEHKENVGLALAVCQQVGVPPEVALEGMRACRGDPGALRIISLSEGGKTLHFVSAMAANDPESTLILFQRAVVDRGLAGPLLVLVNSRKDRPLRSRQLGRLLPKLPAERYLLIGGDSGAVMSAALRAGVAAEAIEELEAEIVEDIVAALFKRTDQTATVFAIGNTAGLGLAVADYFAKKGMAGGPNGLTEDSG